MTAEPRKLLPEAELNVWFALRRLDEQFSELLASVPRTADMRKQWEGYRGRRKALAEPIAAFKRALELALPPDPNPALRDLDRRCLAALMIHYDERELAAIGEEGRNRSPGSLQAEHCEINDGGERFYVYVEASLALALTPGLVIQLLLFCLQGGFCGKFPNQGDVERRNYVAKLSERVVEGVRGEPARADVPRAVRRRIEGVGFPYLDYVIGAAVLMCVCLMLMSRAHTHQKEHEMCKQGESVCR